MTAFIDAELKFHSDDSDLDLNSFISEHSDSSVNFYKGYTQRIFFYFG